MCFKCKKPKHFELDYLIYLKKLLKNARKKRKLTFKKVNLATYGKEDIDFGNNEEKEKEALLCLIALDDDKNEVYDSNLSYSSKDDEIENLYNELYDSFIKENKDLKSKIANQLLLDKINQLEKENYDLNVLAEKLLTESKCCYECETYKAKNNKLLEALQSFTNSKNKLNDMLNNQHNFYKKYGLGFGKRKKNNKPSNRSYGSKTKKHFGYINVFIVIKEDIILKIGSIGMKLMF